jgi:hypothetical protein
MVEITHSRAQSAPCLSTPHRLSNAFASQPAVRAVTITHGKGYLNLLGLLLPAGKSLQKPSPLKGDSQIVILRGSVSCTASICQCTPRERYPRKPISDVTAPNRPSSEVMEPSLIEQAKGEKPGPVT